jgi:chromosome segregation ATPase
MGYQPRKKSARDKGRGYGRFLREKLGKNRRAKSSSYEEEKRILTENEVAEITIKRLHTLGNQRFGSSPFREYFDRWLANVEDVLDEFKGNPSIGVDEEFLGECNATLASIKLQLENKRRREMTTNRELEKLADCRRGLQSINKKYSAQVMAVKARKRRETKHIMNAIDELKREQDTVIRLKTGVLHLRSKKNREKREMEVMQALTENQTKLEVRTMEYNAEEKRLQDEFDEKKEPLFEEIKKLQKKIGDMDTDDSLEERWFACESLIDAVNSFIQRKAAGASRSLL